MNTTRTQTGRDLKTEYIFRKRSTVALWNPSMQNRWNFLAGARVTLLRSSSQGLARGRQGYCCQWKPSDVPALSADCSYLGYSHAVSKFLKFRKTLVEPPNVSEENGSAIRPSAAILPHPHAQH